MSASSILDTREIIWEGGRGGGAHGGRPQSRGHEGAQVREAEWMESDVAGCRVGCSRSDKTLLSSKGSGGH